MKVCNSCDSPVILVLQNLILQIDQACPDLITNGWYLDDGTLIGPIDSVLRALHVIETQYEGWGSITIYRPK